MKTIMRTAVFFTMPLLYLVLFADTLSAQTTILRWDVHRCPLWIGPTPSARHDASGVPDALPLRDRSGQFPCGQEDGGDRQRAAERVQPYTGGFRDGRTQCLRKQADGAFDSHDPDSPVNPFELYLTPDGITVIHKTIILGPVLRWREDTPAFDWELTSDTCTVMGYKCQKAVTEFRGRVWHAWFCPALPCGQRSLQVPRPARPHTQGRGHHRHLQLGSLPPLSGVHGRFSRNGSSIRTAPAPRPGNTSGRCSLIPTSGR